MPAKILVIEDNPANLDLMVYLLGAYGHQTISARDGREGIQAALREKPDLVVCDIQLPLANGYEVALALNKDPRARLIPKIAVTAFAMVGDRERLLTSGFQAYIPKPIDPQTFVKDVDAFLLDGARASAPAVHAEQTADVSTMRGQRATVLLVDNVPANLEYGQTVLESAGFRVVTCDNAARALDIAKGIRPNVIVSDVDMPESEGLGLIQTLKADPDLRDVPFVFITSTSPVLDHRSRTLCQELGCSRYLVRPIEPQRFIAEIEAVLAVPAAEEKHYGANSGC